jgi:hypothetical protein
MVRSFGVCIHTGNLLWFSDESSSASLDLSKATKLKDVVFRPRPRKVGWVTMALQTITSNHRDLRQITIRMPDYLNHFDILVGITQPHTAVESEQWANLDRLLVRLWESHLIRSNLISTIGDTRYQMKDLLPEVTKRGATDISDN